MDKKKVHLVLGSGGARGIAHIGVIEQLEKEGYEIIEIIGCSMGAVVGGIYASGHLKEYTSWLCSLSKKDVFDLMDFTFTRQGFVKGEKLFAKHLEMTGDRKIEEFDIPFTAVATDMIQNREVHFKSGDLYKALRASVSIPGLFVPVVDEGRVLVDGGVLNPLPLNLVEKEEDAMVVAVDVNSKAMPGFELTDSSSNPNSQMKEIRKWFDNLLPDTVQDYRQKRNSEKKEDKIPSYSLFEMMDNTYSLTQDRLTELMTTIYQPDKLIKIPRNLCGIFDFYQAEEIIEMGRRAFDKTKIIPD